MPATNAIPNKDKITQMILNSDKLSFNINGDNNTTKVGAK